MKVRARVLRGTVQPGERGVCARMELLLTFRATNARASAVGGTARGNARVARERVATERARARAREHRVIAGSGGTRAHGAERGRRKETGHESESDDAVRYEHTLNVRCTRRTTTYLAS